MVSDIPACELVEFHPKQNLNNSITVSLWNTSDDKSPERRFQNHGNHTLLTAAFGDTLTLNLVAD